MNFPWKKRRTSIFRIINDYHSTIISDSYLISRIYIYYLSTPLLCYNTEDLIRLDIMFNILTQWVPINSPIIKTISEKLIPNRIKIKPSQSPRTISLYSVNFQRRKRYTIINMNRTGSIRNKRFLIILAIHHLAQFSCLNPCTRNYLFLVNISDLQEPVFSNWIN